MKKLFLILMMSLISQMVFCQDDSSFEDRETTYPYIVRWINDTSSELTVLLGTFDGHSMQEDYDPQVLISWNNYWAYTHHTLQPGKEIRYYITGNKVVWAAFSNDRIWGGSSNSREHNYGFNSFLGIPSNEGIPVTTVALNQKQTTIRVKSSDSRKKAFKVRCTNNAGEDLVVAVWYQDSTGNWIVDKGGLRAGAASNLINCYSSYVYRCAVSIDMSVWGNGKIGAGESPDDFMKRARVRMEMKNLFWTSLHPLEILFDENGTSWVN